MAQEPDPLFTVLQVNTRELPPNYPTGETANVYASLLVRCHKCGIGFLARESVGEQPGTFLKLAGFVQITCPNGHRASIQNPPITAYT